MPPALSQEGRTEVLVTHVPGMDREEDREFSRRLLLSTAAFPLLCLLSRLLLLSFGDIFNSGRVALLTGTFPPQLVFFSWFSALTVL